MLCIITQSGKNFDFLNMSPNHIVIKDIACALSKICRFNGHVQNFYSVAQHSFHVSHLREPGFALEALLHDAAEAYFSAINSQLMQLLHDYRLMIKSVEEAIADKFGLPHAMSALVKNADLVILATERRALI